MNQHVNVKARIDAAKRKDRAKGMKWAKAKFYELLNEFGSRFLTRQRQIADITTFEMNRFTSIDIIEGVLAYLTRKIKGYRFATDFTCPRFSIIATYAV